MLFPFLYLFRKQNAWHDFAFFIGVLGGLGAIFYPIPVGGYAFSFDTIRFYVCHITIFAVPTAAAVLGVYRPRLSRFWAIPLLFLVWETIIFFNELILLGAGLVNAKFADLLDPAFRNSGFVFGVNSDFAWAHKLLDPLVPNIFKMDAFRLNGGKPFFFPVLWMLVPGLIYIPMIYAVISSPFWACSLVKKRRAAKQDFWIGA